MSDDGYSINNTNIYIMGTKNCGYNEGNIVRNENFFVSRTKDISEIDRYKIIKLFAKQLKTTEMMEEVSKEVKALDKKLFSGKAKSIPDIVG